MNIQGRPSPMRQWCISLLFQISPYFRKISQTPSKIFPIWPFPEQFSYFHPQNIWWPLFSFSHRLQFCNVLPCFRSFSPFSSISEKCSFSSYFCKFPPWFRKICFFYILSVTFVFPYFDHDAFMHHTMHVLDAPVNISKRNNLFWILVIDSFIIITKYYAI